MFEEHSDSLDYNQYKELKEFYSRISNFEELDQDVNIKYYIFIKILERCKIKNYYLGFF
jgi:hypothetical protein